MVSANLVIAQNQIDLINENKACLSYHNSTILKYIWYDIKYCRILCYFIAFLQCKISLFFAWICIVKMGYNIIKYLAEYYAILV